MPLHRRGELLHLKIHHLTSTIGLHYLPSMDTKMLEYETKDLTLGGKSSSCNESSLSPVRSEESWHTATEQGVVWCSLDQLPIGILHKVVDHLDLVALVCLKSSNRHFYTSISIDRSVLCVCTRWRIHIAVWDDSPNRLLEKACMLCKTKRIRRKFGNRDERLVLNSPSQHRSDGHRKDPIMREKIRLNYLAKAQWTKDDKWIPTEWTIMDHTTALFYKIPKTPKPLVESCLDYTLEHMYYFSHGYPRELDPKKLFRWSLPADGICYDHLMDQFGSNSTIEALLPLIQISPRPMWLRFTVLRCTHCGRCIEEGDKRKYGCMKCFCDVCHRSVDQQHCRTGPRRTHNPQIRRISMDEKGFVWIHEVGSKFSKQPTSGRLKPLTLSRQGVSPSVVTSEPRGKRKT